jgi:hypothetical protein
MRPTTATTTKRWEREGGGGLPPAESPPHTEVVWLFTCLNCGFRAADPPAPLTGCSCGGEIVVHKFEYDAYQRIRRFSDPRDPCDGGERR